MMHFDFGNQLLAQEIRLIFGKIHIVLLTECIVHHNERMKGEIRQFVGIGIDPPNGTGGLQSETSLICKSHREIIRIAGSSQAFEMADGTA